MNLPYSKSRKTRFPRTKSKCNYDQRTNTLGCKSVQRLNFRRDEYKKKATLAPDVIIIAAIVAPSLLLFLSTCSNYHCDKYALCKWLESIQPNKPKNRVSRSRPREIPHKLRASSLRAFAIVNSRGWAEMPVGREGSAPPVKRIPALSRKCSPDPSRTSRWGRRS